MDTQPIPLNALLEAAVDAAQSAGRQALDQMTFVPVSVKNGSELVTEADRACQRAIVQRIRADFPNHGLVAEEGEGGRPTRQPPTGTEPVWWVVDPIDGTTNYAHGMPVFTVSIAAMIHGSPAVGVIYEPAANLLFTAARGGQARMNDRVLDAGHEPVSLFAGVGLDCHFGPAVPPWFLQVMLKSRFRNLGTTALQMAYVAKGAMAGTIACTPKLWDIAAGAVLAESAGAVVTDWQGRPLWPMDLASYEGGPLPCVAANPTAHRQILAMIQGGPS
ncbi:MAG: inositol monophosphatase [Phycisphaerae bacterium]|nr:inositol monophosphatase [Phycisphaerae bacterium]